MLNKTTQCLKLTTVAAAVTSILSYTGGTDASICLQKGNACFVNLISVTAFNEDVSDHELTKAEKRALKRRQKKERREAEKNKRELERKRKERAELIRKTLESRRKMLETEVKSDTVWKNCNVVVLSADEGLDPDYIERMLRTYLSSIARLIADKESYGECIIDVVIDKEGKCLQAELLQNSFNNDELADELEQFFITRNYGKSSKKEQASVQLLVTRELTQSRSTLK